MNFSCLYLYMHVHWFPSVSFAKEFLFMRLIVLMRFLVSPLASENQASMELRWYREER